MKPITLIPASASFDELPTVAPYAPAKSSAPAAAGASFYDSKLQALKNNAAQAKTQESAQVAPPPSAVQPPATESGNFQAVPGAFEDMYGGKTPLKSADISKELLTQDPKAVSMKAYQLDPEYRAFVDHYKNGSMDKLPDSIKNNFDSFALNTHYMGTLAQERMPDLQAMSVRTEPTSGQRGKLQRPELAPNGNLADKVGEAVRAPVTTLALGAKLTINDFENIFRSMSGKPTKSSQAVIEEHRAMLEDSGSSLTPESALYWTSKEAKFGAAFAKSPLVQAGIGGLGGLGETTALGAMGNDVTMRDYLSNIASSAALPVASAKGAALFGPAGAAGQFIPQSSWIGRIATTGAQGMGGGAAAGLTEGLGDQGAGRGAFADTLAKTGQYGAYGLMLGGIFGAGREIFKAAPIAFNNARSNSQNPVEVNRAEAIALDPAADKPIRAGVDPLFIRHAQDSTLDDLAGYKEQIDITRQKMGSFGGTENVKRSVGDKIIDALKTTFKAKEEAGAELGRIRESLSGAKVVPAAAVEDDFMNFLNSKGIALDPKGKQLVDTYGVLETKDLGALRLLWDKMPDGDYSARELDVLRQNINDLFNRSASLKQSEIAPAIMALKSSATKAISPLVPEEYLKNMAKFAEAADITDDAAAMLRLPGDKGLSPSQLKAGLGERELRAGELANRLTSNAAGRTEPFINKLEAYAHSQGWAWEGNIQNQAQFSRFIERMTGTQQAGSMEGINKAGVDALNLSNLAGKALDKAKAQAGATNWSKLDALDDYIQELQKRQWKGSPDLQTASSLYDDVRLTPEEEATGLIGGSEVRPSGNTVLAEAAGKELSGKNIPNTRGFVFHATTPERAAEIMKSGLQPVDGKVFLAPSADIARSAVGTTNADPVILKIPIGGVGKAFTDPNVGEGVPTFYTDSAIPAEFIKLFKK